MIDRYKFVCGTTQNTGRNDTHTQYIVHCTLYAYYDALYYQYIIWAIDNLDESGFWDIFWKIGKNDTAC